MEKEIVSEIIEMAWDDQTSFDQIEKLHGLSEKNVIKLLYQGLVHLDRADKSSEVSYYSKNVKLHVCCSKSKKSNKCSTKSMTHNIKALGISYTLIKTYLVNILREQTLI